MSKWYQFECRFLPIRLRFKPSHWSCGSWHLLVQRLKSRAQFQAVLAGHTVARTPHFALHQLTLPHLLPVVSADAGSMSSDLFPAPAVLWLGAMVPKRWAKRAVTRNTIKRQVYVLTDEFELQLPVAAYVLRLRAAFDKKQFVSATSDILKQAVRTELQALFARASIKPALTVGATL